MHVLRVWILLSSRAIAWSPHPAGMRPKYISLPSKSSPVASESGGDLNFASRIESGKAAICSTVAGTVAATPFLLLAPGAFRAPEWEFQADGLPIMLFLFGIVYRYAVRMDDNPMLRQGVIGAFAITRSWALGLVALAETGVACSAAAYVIEAAFARGWIQRCK